MNEFAAAMGLCNLRHLDNEIAKRKKVAEKYHELLADTNGIHCLKIPSDINWNYSYFPILIDETEFSKTRNDIYKILKENNIFSRKYFYPLTCDQACFRNEFRHASVTNARYAAERILTIPLYANLPPEKAEFIINTIKK